MTYNLKARMILESVHLELSGEQVQRLVGAQKPLAELITFYAENRPQTTAGALAEALRPALLEPVTLLLSDLAAATSQAAEVQTKKLTGGRGGEGDPGAGGGAGHEVRGISRPRA